MINLQFNYKKLLLLLILIIIAVLGWWLIWRMLNPTSPITPPSDEGALVIDPLTGLPTAGPGGSGQVITDGQDLPTNVDNVPEGYFDNQYLEDILTTDTTRDNKISGATTHRVVDPTITKTGAVQYYNPLDGHFYHLNANGQAELLSDQKFNQVRQVAWSPQQDKAVLYYPDNTKTIYNFTTDTQVTLPAHWDEFAWSPNGEQIAFKSMGAQTDSRWLATINSDGSGSQKVEKIGDNADKVIVNWSPNNQVMATMSEGADYDRKIVYLIGFNGENFRAITTEGRGFEYEWSPQGTTMLFSTYSSLNGYRPMLWRVDAQGDTIGDNKAPLNLETWAHKCSFLNNNTAYCAVPQTLAEGAGLFPQTADATPDDLYYVNLDTGEKVMLDSTNYNMQNLMVTSDEKTLYFTDNFTGRLHKITL